MASKRSTGGEGCIFCRIAAGTAPAHFVLKREVCVAFLDARPLFKGHVLVVPRAHRPTLLELPADDAAPLVAATQTICRAIEHALGADGTFVALNNRVSQSVPHLHLHVIPRRRGDGMRNFFWPRTPYASDAEAASFAERIRAAID